MACVAPKIYVGPAMTIEVQQTALLCFHALATARLKG